MPPFRGASTGSTPPLFRRGEGLSSSPFQRPGEVPPEIVFISLPPALAQFHHLPAHVPVWIHRQNEIQEKGYDFNEGVRVMEELLQAAPAVPGAYLYRLFLKKWDKLGSLQPYFETDRIAEAIPRLVEILDIDPECPLTCFQLGYCFRATGELEKSESFYKQALRMAPDAGWIHSNLGRTYMAMDKRREAAEAFWTALQLLPGDQFLLEQLTVLGELIPVPNPEKPEDPPAFIRRGDFERKMKETLKKEESPEALCRWGWKLLGDRFTELARECFETALRGPQSLPEARLGLGTALLETGNYNEAEKHLTEYLDGNPESATAHLNLFKAYLALGEKDLAWDELQSSVRLDPDQLDPLRQLLHLFQESDREEEGIEWLDRLAADNPGRFTPIWIKAQALARVERWEEAREAFEAAIGLAPHREEVLLDYSAELGKRGLRKELIELLLAEPQPLPLSLTINLALAYSQDRKKGKALKLLEEFLRGPGRTETDKARIRMLLKELGESE